METADDLVVATSIAAVDDAVADTATAEGFGVFRGAEDDVLSRFVGALDWLTDPPEVVLRICADRPLLCPRLADELVSSYGAHGRPDYLSNTLPKTFPDGLDLELVRADALRAAAAETDDPYDREHVTPFLYRNPNRFSLVGVCCPFGDFSRIRATVDYEDDLHALDRVHARLTERVGEYVWRDVVLLALTEPELFPVAPAHEVEQE